MGKIVIIDGNFWLFSCYYATAAMGNLMVNKDGVPTNAVYGFANRLEHLLKQEPEYLVVAFDAKGKTFRSELLQEYKGTRKETPDELICQFSMVREFLDAHHIPFIEVEGYEGDDIIGTISKKASDQGMDVSIFTNDKDMMQLINDHVVQYKKPQKTNEYEMITKESFYEKYQHYECSHGLGYTKITLIKNETETEFLSFVPCENDEFTGYEISFIKVKNLSKKTKKYGMRCCIPYFLNLMV